nr:unnamed protein product [Spirometra erinaceieuropaei]
MRPTSEGEVADVMQKLRNNEALAEIYKPYVDTRALCLYEVHGQPWSGEVAPDDGLGHPCTYPQKGDKTRCEKYHGISLISAAVKTFGSVLLKRLQAVLDSRTRSTKLDSGAGHGCAEQIFTLRHILEFRHNYRQPTTVFFVDFGVTFNSVHHGFLWRIMALHDVPSKSIVMTKACYHFTTERVLVHNNLSPPLGIRSGVRQDRILSTIPFNYAIDWVVGRALQEDD